MIFGIGTDMVEIERIESVWRRFGERFARKILSPTETSEFFSSAQPARFLAKRFAVKEAFSKAFGTGIGADLSWQDIGVLHEPSGKPVLAPSGRLAALLRERRIRSSHVSISDERAHALAFIILEKE